ncbi:hypothetical protein C8R44DRAFT_730504 [Mycena epipterygia]|nr:hypothetical protein C8R44DRAFT_730504 [Mycena epipterygia]
MLRGPPAAKLLRVRPGIRLLFLNTIDNSSVRPTDSLTTASKARSRRPNAPTDMSSRGVYLLAGLFTPVNTLTANSIPNTANCLSALQAVDTNCPFSKTFNRAVADSSSETISGSRWILAPGRVPGRIFLEAMKWGEISLGRSADNLGSVRLKHI